MMNTDRVKRNKKKGFTLIELIVVMAVIGILVLLAAPRFLGHTKEARDTGIVNDIKTAEDKVSEYLMRHEGFPSGWLSAEKTTLEDKVAVGTLYGREGVASGVKGGEYRLIPAPFIKQEVRSQLVGAFYANENGDVYYFGAGGAGSKETPAASTVNPLTYEAWLSAVEASPNGYVWATDADFTYVEDAESPDGVGYYNYTGTAAYVIIPDTIKGELQTHNYLMFLSAREVYGVAAYNPNVTSMHYMFCAWRAEDKSRALELDYLNTFHVADMSHMFDYADFHKPFVLELDMTNVTNMNEMFAWVAFFDTFTIGDVDTSNVRDMSGLFNVTYFDTDVDLGLQNLETGNVTNMSEMFWDLDADKTLVMDVSGFDTSKVTDMSWMFALLYVEGGIPVLDVTGFDTSNVTDMTSMFEDTFFTRNDEMEELDVSNFNTSKVTSMESMFMNTATKKLNISGFDTRNVTNMNSMFDNVGGDGPIEELDVSSFNTSKVTDMAGMFADITLNTPLDLSGFDTSNVTNLSFLFAESELTVLGLTGFDTSKVVNMRSMFEDTIIGSLDLSSFDTSSVSVVDVYQNGGFVSVPATYEMFLGTTATTGYARNQHEADRFNNAAATGIPNTLFFTVK